MKKTAVTVGTQITVRLDELTENPKNPNKESKFVFSKLVQSIQEFGFVDPIIVREKSGKYEIIGGAHRAKAAAKLGLSSIPAVNLGKIDDLTANRLLLVLNETRGQNDADALAAIIQSIHTDGGDEAIQVLPYTDAQITELLDGLGDDDSDIEDEPIAEEIPDEREAKIKPADIAGLLELQGVSQDNFKRIILSFRKWRRTKDANRPAWELLLTALENDRG